jgi:hypothetical protein
LVELRGGTLPSPNARSIALSSVMSPAGGDGADMVAPSGEGATRCVLMALEEAKQHGVEKIDYVNKMFAPRACACSSDSSTTKPPPPAITKPSRSAEYGLLQVVKVLHVVY